MDNEMKNVIVNYILESEDNLRLAYKVASAFNNIKESVYKGFLLKLQEELYREFDKNEIKIINEFYDNPMGAWQKFYIRKNKWNEKYTIAFGANRKQKIYFGINIMENKKTEIDKKIRKKLDSGCINNSIKSFEEDYWIWEIWLNEEYGNWGDEEVLANLWGGVHGENFKILNYFKNLIIQVINIIDPIIKGEK